MVSHDALDASALEQAAWIRSRKLSAEELVRCYLRRIAFFDPQLCAFVHVDPKQAIAEARRKDAAAMRGGDLPPFHGVPIGIKDLNFVRGFRMSAGSRAMRWMTRSPIDDRSAANLRRAGFVILGKLATSEFGAMPVTEPAIHPPTRNPWNLEHTAGGSSGGSAAAVAARMLPLAHGSDGGGSVRIPAGFCNLFGLKPTRARLPNQFGLRSTRILYTCGPITRTVDDAAAMLDAMIDRKPAADVPLSAAPFLELARQPLRRLRIKLATVSPWGTTHPDIAAATERVAHELERDGHHIERSAAIHGTVEEFLPLWQMLIGSVPVLLWQLQPVTRWLAESGRRARRTEVADLHDRLAQRVLSDFGDADLWITPTCPVPPPRVGAWRNMTPVETFNEAAVLGAFTAVFNVSGQPAVSVPAGFTSDGLPIGVQLVARKFDEATLLAVARWLEQALPWRGHKPSIAA